VTATATVRPTESFEYYGTTIYWNDFPAIQQHLNKLATGHSTGLWMDQLRKYPPARRMLALNCGNGWVERELWNAGYAKSIIGTDIMEPLLAEARSRAAAIRMPAEYRILDANTGSLAGLDFDHVLNYAALHHVACIDHLVREILINIPDDGIFINYDYIGPHRNQYPWPIWSRIVELYDQLPPILRPERLHYPHMKTMLATDPTEAIHSEFVVSTIKRYFDVVECYPLGGSICYQLLWQNAGLYQARDTTHGAYWLERIIEADMEFTDGRIENSLFAVLICRPRKSALDDTEQLARWTAEENEREAQAASNGGRYYPRSALEIMYENE